MGTRVINSQMSPPSLTPDKAKHEWGNQQTIIVTLRQLIATKDIVYMDILTGENLSSF